MSYLQSIIAKASMMRKSQSADLFDEDLSDTNKDL